MRGKVFGMSMFSLELGVSKWFSEESIREYLVLVDIENYAERWGINLYEPARIDDLSSYDDQDYSEYYEIYTYKDDEKLLNQMIEVDMESVERINQSIRKFFCGATTGARQIYKQHPFKAEIKDYYIYKDKGKGVDVTILIYKLEERKLYVLEKLGSC